MKEWDRLSDNHGPSSKGFHLDRLLDDLVRFFSPKPPEQPRHTQEESQAQADQRGVGDPETKTRDHYASKHDTHEGLARNEARAEEDARLMDPITKSFLQILISLLRSSYDLIIEITAHQEVNDTTEENRYCKTDREIKTHSDGEDRLIQEDQDDGKLHANNDHWNV